ncbi:hypothetical protein [Neorhodopirellula pilleata]|uniref:Competence protein A n=1 Tax=Neorhodopirellula pilleata TaxID=2714738 RepID=A0A5C6A2M0_9BACT|nr:hypothetical protein [Neorhodopirellula pilleata]TWT93590.1 hypothetical protein Pla100_41080 [Neorhodopirellula pilleata]
MVACLVPRVSADGLVTKKFAFRVEHDRIVLAVAEIATGVPARIVIDHESLVATEEHGEVPADWLEGEGNERLRQAIKSLAMRHQLNSDPVAVSLSGDFCVTRISTGTIEHVDQELSALASRIPRYLQLGPGEKLTGQVRESLQPGIEHALTSVGNHTRLQSLYRAFADNDVNVAWIEPSLVSLARLVGMLGIDQDKPILIADSFGRSWEVGIAHQGRLLLDYRPAAAHDSETFAKAIDHHLARLRRFCLRHRRMVQSELSDLYLGGPPQKITPVLEHFAVQDEHNPQKLRAVELKLPAAFMIVEVAPEIESDSIVGVAAILPLLHTAIQQEPPDLLQSIRRDVKISKWRSLALTWWPAVTAAIVLVGLSLWVGGLQRQAQQKREQRGLVETQMRQTRVRMASLQSDQRWVEHLQTIQGKTRPVPMAILVKQITQCLPPRSSLQSIRLEGERSIQLTGKTPHESEIYEIVNYLRRIPGVTQVALLGTMLGSEENESQFNIRLSWTALSTSEQTTQPDQEFQDD